MRCFKQNSMGVFQTVTILLHLTPSNSSRDSNEIVWLGEFWLWIMAATLLAALLLLLLQLVRWAILASLDQHRESCLFTRWAVGHSVANNMVTLSQVPTLAPVPYPGSHPCSSSPPSLRFPTLIQVLHNLQAELLRCPISSWKKWSVWYLISAC